MRICIATAISQLLATAVRFVRINRHKHPEDRHVVVPPVTWATGMGDAFEPKNLTR